MRRPKRKVEQPTVDCEVTPGMFSNERGVTVKTLDGRQVFALVHRRHVIIDQEPASGSEVPGRVKVALVSVGKDSALVDLPQPTITQGPRVKVAVSSLSRLQ